MISIVKTMAKFSYNDLAKIYFEQNNKNDVILHILKDPYFELCDHLKKINNFLTRLNKRYNECYRNKEKMFNCNKQWLTSELVFESQPKPANVGRPARPVEECSERSRRRKLQSINEEFSQETIKDTFFHQLGPTKNKTKKIDIIENVMKASPKRVKRILKSMPTPTDDKKFTSEEAFSIFLDLKLTKYQYMELRKRAVGKHCSIYPEYRDLVLIKKDCLPPQNSINITESSAEVVLQDILNHTAERLLNTLDADNIKKLGDCSLTLISKWGCDGSSGQKRYKQYNAEKYQILTYL